MFDERFSILILFGASSAIAQQAGTPQQAMVGVSNPPATAAQPSKELEEVVVTAARRGLIRTATTASEGVVVNDELALTPAYRKRSKYEDRALTLKSSRPRLVL